MFAANGCLFPIMGDAYRGGDHLARAIDLGVAPHLRYATDGRPLLEPVAEFAKNRRRATVFCILNALGPVVFGFSSLILFVDWRYNDGPIWWAIVGGVVAPWCAVVRRGRPATPPPNLRRVHPTIIVSAAFGLARPSASRIKWL